MLAWCQGCAKPPYHISLGDAQLHRQLSTAGAVTFAVGHSRWLIAPEKNDHSVVEYTQC